MTNSYAGTSQAALVNGNGAVQCIQILQPGPSRPYTVIGRAKPDAISSYGQFELDFFLTADCSGDAKRFASPPVTTESVWQRVTLTGLAPDSAQSVLVRAFVTAPPGRAADAPPASVLFDNILVTSQ